VQHRIGALRRAVVSEVEDTNRLIYHVLRGGVVVSVSILLFGFILVAVTGRPGEDRCIYFQDPDGHRLQLMVRRAP